MKLSGAISPSNSLQLSVGEKTGQVSDSGRVIWKYGLQKEVKGSTVVTDSNWGGNRKERKVCEEQGR